MDEYERAIDCYLQGIEIAKKHSAKKAELVNSSRLLEVCYISKRVDLIKQRAAEMEKLAQEYGHWDHLARLRAIQGHLLLDEEKSEEAITKYTEAMTYALHFNCYLLDEVVEKTMEKAKEIAGKGQVEAAGALIERLIEFWQTGTLDGKPLVEPEREGREWEKGDGKPQPMVVEQLGAWLRTLEGESNTNSGC